LGGTRSPGLYQRVMREVEEPLLRVVLRHADGNQTRAAEILGITRATLRRKLRDLGLAAD
jgi:Fis family transcriptional regulator